MLAALHDRCLQVAIWEMQPRGAEVLGSLLCPDGHLPKGRLDTAACESLRRSPQPRPVGVALSASWGAGCVSLNTSCTGPRGSPSTGSLRLSHSEASSRRKLHQGPLFLRSTHRAGRLL